MFPRVVLTKFLVLGVGVLSAGALMLPDWLLQRNKAARALTEEQRAVALNVTHDADIVWTPEEFFDHLLSSRPAGAAELPYVYYGVVAMTERREGILEAYGTRLKALEQARDALQDYVGRANRALRNDVVDSAIKPALLEPAGSVPRIEKTAAGLRVFRFLPWPEGRSSDEVVRLREAAESDAAAAEQMSKKVVDARKDYEHNQSHWYRWIASLYPRVLARTESELKAGKYEDRP